MVKKSRDVPMLIGLGAPIEGRDWISGDALSLADIAIATPFGSTLRARLPVTELKNVQRRFASMQALEVWKKTAAP